MKKMNQLGEFGWLKSLLPRLYWPACNKSQLWIGPGDDAGVLRITPGRVLVATTDAMVEGIHFERKWFTWQDLGYKVLAVNLSDLAAMGDVKPLAALVTASFPGDTPVDNVNNFQKGMHKCAQLWKTGFLGGDTVGSKRDWSISVMLLGEAKPAGLIQRSGAKVGDYLVASGPLGLAAAGLDVLRTGSKRLAWTRPLLEAFNHPRPRFDVGSVLGRGRLATSLMDCSDGLEASVKLLAEASGLGAEIDMEALPVHPALDRWARHHRRRTALDYIVKGGEDYELIFTVNPKTWSDVSKKIPGVYRFGRMLAKSAGLYATAAGRRSRLESYGYAHF